jgi:ATP-dependent DNA ligase
MCCTGTVGKAAEPPKWIKPQLSRVVDEAPAGDDWLHEIKYDGYRMHARLDRGKVQVLTRTGLDWSRHYPRTIEALRSLPVKTAYLDGELCALRPDGVPAFSRLQALWTSAAPAVARNTGLEAACFFRARHYLRRAIAVAKYHPQECAIRPPPQRAQLQLPTMPNVKAIA